MYPRLKYKWWLLAFLFVTFFLEQGTRQIYNAALPQIRADFLANGVTDTQLGMVGTVFSAVFGLSLVGSGLAKIIDRLAVRRPRIKLEVSMLAFLLCIGPVLLVARAGSLTSCCVALTLFGITYGVYDAAHYPAMFDCVEPRYRSATTGLTGCLAFVIGSLAPALLGWMGEHLSMRTALASIGGFYLLGALVLVPAVLIFFNKDYIGNESELK